MVAFTLDQQITLALTCKASPSYSEYPCIDRDVFDNAPFDNSLVKRYIRHQKKRLEKWIDPFQNAPVNHEAITKYKNRRNRVGSGCSSSDFIGTSFSLDDNDDEIIWNAPPVPPRNEFLQRNCALEHCPYLNPIGNITLHEDQNCIVNSIVDVIVKPKAITATRRFGQQMTSPSGTSHFTITKGQKGKSAFRSLQSTCTALPRTTLDITNKCNALDININKQLINSDIKKQTTTLVKPHPNSKDWNSSNIIPQTEQVNSKMYFSENHGPRIGNNTGNTVSQGNIDTNGDTMVDTQQHSIHHGIIDSSGDAMDYIQQANESILPENTDDSINSIILLLGMLYDQQKSDSSYDHNNTSVKCHRSNSISHILDNNSESKCKTKTYIDEDIVDITQDFCGDTNLFTKTDMRKFGWLTPLRPVISL